MEPDARAHEPSPERGEEPLDVLVWSDYLCPWCYLGLERAAYLERQHGAVVTWLPYDLHPEIPDGGIEVTRLFRGADEGGIDAYMRRLEVLADEAGLPIRRPSRIPRTRRALEAAEWARHREPDSFEGFHRGIFDAYWVEGRDIEDVGVLREVAGATGVDGTAMEAALIAGEAGASVDQSTALAQEVGVTGTPAWLMHGSALVPGAQPHDVFDRVVARLGGQRLG